MHIDGNARTGVQSSGMRRISPRLRALVIIRLMILALALAQLECRVARAEPEFIRVSQEGRHFVFSGSGSDFQPWGFNYDHDASNRLLETYWIKEWNAVAGDFEEMKRLGANTVRIHLQVSRLMKSADKTNRESLAQLARLLTLAQKTGLYLDITGLGCFPLSCSIAELDQFIDGSRPLAAGWIGFYWGKTIAEYKREKRSIADSIALDWLEYFGRKTPDIQGLRPMQQVERKSD